MKEEDISSNSKDLGVEKSTEGADDVESEESQSELTGLKKKIEELKEKNQKLTDDMDFLKRQVAATVNHYREEFQNKSNAFDRDKTKMLKQMIGLFQELSRIIKNTEIEEDKTVFTGLRDRVQIVIDNNDGEVISPEIGGDFDSREHKALSTKNTEDKNQNGKIAELLAAGVKMGDKVILPANVITFVGD
jgi:molecular chaperone GrpE